MPDAPRDPNRRLTNAERREEARRKRDELQRQMAKKKRTRLVGGVALLLVAALLVAVVVLQPFAGDDANAQAANLLKRAPAAATTAGCTEVETVGPYDGVSDPNDPGFVDTFHIGTGDFPTPPRLSTYPSLPPTSGPHAPIPPGPMPAGIYDQPPDIYRAIHSLEHGATIIWYDPTVTGPALDELISFYDRKVSSAGVGQDRVLIGPYDYPAEGEAGRLPPGVQMALVSWHRLQTCSSPSLPVAFAFTSTYSSPTAADQTYAGEAPEAGSAL